MPQLCEDPKSAEEAAEILKAIAHPLRLRIITILCDGKQHVNALAERLGVSQSIVSQQLRILRMRKLVSATRNNGHAHYRVIEPHLHKMLKCMSDCLTRRGENLNGQGDA